MEADTDEERERAKRTAAIKAGASYRLAYEDRDFLSSDDLRPVRLQLELLKPERYLRQNNVRSTIVVFGSARLLSPAQARSKLALLEDQALTQPDDPGLEEAIVYARRQLEYSRYYTEALRLSETVSRRFQYEGRRDFVVVTGGGPGAMEAANRGAFNAGARSIGLNITLPHEQEPNSYISPELCFQFRYFGLRKMHFLLRAKALVAFPGGYGTLDELFETLTLIQTGKVERMPIVLVGEKFWHRVIDFEFLMEEGMIDQRDLDLFTIVETADEVIAALYDFYQGVQPV
ncbi:MAG: TIGR00730 family Rossman fold protein [Gammaproteobacteria bacterium]|nr:TIGR00730 family Rossman fold protein [Gammaproteobacteria bacterium]MCW9088009.1 TIGR00730 family Rossman fold protein [Gammaproteobacteria bacterium]